MTAGDAGLRSASPGVPGVDLDPGADAPALAVRVVLAAVVAREPVDVGLVGVVGERDDAPAEADVAVPPVAVEDGERNPRIGAQVPQALAPLVHVHQHAPVLPEVPGGDGVRRAVGLQRGDDRGVGHGRSSYPSCRTIARARRRTPTRARSGGSALNARRRAFANRPPIENAGP